MRLSIPLRNLLRTERCRRYQVPGPSRREGSRSGRTGQRLGDACQVRFGEGQIGDNRRRFERRTPATISFTGLRPIRIASPAGVLPGVTLRAYRRVVSSVLF